MICARYFDYQFTKSLKHFFNQQCCFISQNSILVLQSEISTKGLSSHPYFNWLENVPVYGCDDNSLTNNHLWKTKRWSRIRASCQQNHSQAQPNLKSQNRQKFSIVTMALHHNLMMFTHGMSESKFCFTIFIGKVKQYYFMLIAC